MASTNTDFRIAIGLFDHPKMIKLEKRLGVAAQIALFRLWEFTTINRSDGVLSSMDAEDIAIAAKWGGDSTQFIETLIHLRWLDRSDDDTIVVHDWQINNPWAAGAAARSAGASTAARARWAKVRGEDGNECDRNAESCAPHKTALRNDAGSNTPFLSSPFLSESLPNPKDSPQPPQGAGVGLEDILKEDSDAVGGAEHFDPKEHFAQFYTAYPLKKARDAAERKFCTKVRSRDTFDVVMAGLERAKRSDAWTSDGGKYIPHPATWLNQGGWKDEILELADGGTVYLPDGRMFVDGREVDVQAMLEAGRTPMVPKPEAESEVVRTYRKPSEIPGFRYFGNRGGKSIAEIGREHAARHGH